MPVVFICFHGYIVDPRCFEKCVHPGLWTADLGNTKEENTNLDLCITCETHVAGQVLGAQWTNGIWSLWLKTEKARAYMSDKVKTLIIYNQNVEIHGDYPMSKPVHNGLS